MALAQVDIKRALSYTTTAYLGLVFILISLRLPAVALLLLLSHALSKALLTMSIGSVILISNSQDLTELGGFGPRTPATTTAYVVGAPGHDRAGSPGLLLVLWAGSSWDDLPAVVGSHCAAHQCADRLESPASVPPYFPGLTPAPKPAAPPR